MRDGLQDLVDRLWALPAAGCTPAAPAGGSGSSARGAPIRGTRQAAAAAVDLAAEAGRLLHASLEAARLPW